MEAEGMKYEMFDPEMLTRLYEFLISPRTPVRIMPKKWPDPKLIGKAMARGWATPCRYYPAGRRQRGFIMPIIAPGISDAEYVYILAIFRQEEKKNAE